MCIEYIDSYISDLKTNHSLRFIILDHHINGIFIIKHNLEKYIEDLNKIYGYCSFVIDAIFCNNSIYICEIGLKNFDYTQFKKTESKLKKLSLSKKEYFKFIKNNILKNC